MIKLDKITKVFSSDIFKKSFKALDEISFEVKEGNLTGFLGANGAGKTTSIKIMMDFIRATSGQVIYSKQLGGSLKEAVKYIGYLPERPYFYPNLTGREFVQYLGQLSSLNKSQIEEKIKYWSPRFKIDHALDRMLKNYSKGMLQRIGMVSTLVHSPKLVILDEPLSGLDPVGRKEIKDILKEINKNEGITIFFSSHIVYDVEEICHDVIFVKDGKLAYEGKVDTLLKENSKNIFHLKFYEGDNLKIVEVNGANLNREIQNLLSQGKNLYEVQPQKPTLEDIIYRL